MNMDKSPKEAVSLSMPSRSASIGVFRETKIPVKSYTKGIIYIVVEICHDVGGNFNIWA